MAPCMNFVSFLIFPAISRVQGTYRGEPISAKLNCWQAVAERNFPSSKYWILASIISIYNQHHQYNHHHQYCSIINYHGMACHLFWCTDDYFSCSWWSKRWRWLFINNDEENNKDENIQKTRRPATSCTWCETTIPIMNVKGIGVHYHHHHHHHRHHHHHHHHHHCKFTIITNSPSPLNIITN